MFTITYAAALFSIFLVVGAAAFTLSRNNTKLARALALYCLTAAVWIGGNAASDVSYTVPALLLASSIAYLGGALNLFLFLVLVDLIIDRRTPSQVRLILYGIPVLGMVAFSFSTYAIIGTYFPAGAPAQIIPGPLYLITLFVLVAALAYGVARLLRALSQEPEETRRVELSYVLLGLMLSLLGEIIFDIVLPLLGELRFYTLGPITSLFFIAACGYVLLEHRLFDIRLGMQRGMVYSFLLTLLIGAYAGLLSLLLLLSPLESVTAIYVSAGLTLIAGAFGIPAIEQFFRRLTDPIFFQDTYDYAEALHILSEILYRNLALADLVQESEQALTQILKAQWVGITYACEGGIDMPDLDAIAERKVLGVPITHHGTYIGAIYAGPKRGGGAYTEQDERLLATFAYQAATAFARAELHETTKRHAEELERTVAERTRELRKAQENERRILIDLSHNLQTPLAVFQARLEQLKQAKLHRDDVQSLEQSVKRLSSFIYDLLALAKLESEVPEVSDELNLSELVIEIVEELGIIAESKQVRIESAIASRLYVRGNQKRLREAILNIASNALTYLLDQGERCISFSLVAASSEAQLTIADTGRGIPPEDLPHVFERFYRRQDTSDLPTGSGLGLSIAARIIAHHGGRMTIESTAGHGTSVHLYLPILATA